MIGCEPPIPRGTHLVVGAEWVLWVLCIFYLIPEAARYYVLYFFYLFILLVRILYCATLGPSVDAGHTAALGCIRPAHVSRVRSGPGAAVVRFRVCTKPVRVLHATPSAGVMAMC